MPMATNCRPRRPRIVCRHRELLAAGCWLLVFLVSALWRWWQVLGIRYLVFGTCLTGLIDGCAGANNQIPGIRQKYQIPNTCHKRHNADTETPAASNQCRVCKITKQLSPSLLLLPLS